MTPRRRAGTTLIEVLVAIFVMGIGLLAILAMFPLGAMKMADGIRDDRIGHCVANARAIASARNLRTDGTLDNCMNNPTGTVTNQAVYQTAPPEGPSWAVYCDPVGFNTYATGAAGSNTQTWVAGRTTDGIARRSVGFVQNAPAIPTGTNTSLAQRMLVSCALLDDITFGVDGLPAQAVAGSTIVDRGGSYSWAWLLRRPKAGNKTICNVTVVVYTQRSLSMGVKLAGKEAAFQGSFPQGPGVPGTIRLTWTPGAVPPQVKEGGWVFDMTPGPRSGGIWTPGNANFHRVVSVSDTQTQVVGGVTQNYLDLELATPIQWPAAWNTAVAGDAYRGNGPLIAVLDGVTEVIDTGAGWRAWSN